MAATGGSGALRGVGEGFTRTASDYDASVRHNVHGAARLVASLPVGEYPRILDVGCGTGWATLAMLDRFGSRRVTGVDASEGMLEISATSWPAATTSRWSCAPPTSSTWGSSPAPTTP